MKKMLLVLCVFTMLTSFVFANYMNSFSAAVEAWNQGKISQALSLMNLSLSSTFNTLYAPDLWYFKARLDLMSGKINDARQALDTVGTVFKSRPVSNLLKNLTDASITSFSPVVDIKYVDSIMGFHDGEVFYSPISVAIRRNSYYVLDTANRFVEEFGSIQQRYELNVNSTPTAMIYSNAMDSFFVSFENGDVYKYTPNFSTKKKFVSKLSHPVVFCTDNAGRVYVGEYGEDAVSIFEYNGVLKKKIHFFDKKVHIFSYGRVFGSTFYIMDLTDKEVRKFDIISGKELSNVPFPKDVIPFTFEVIYGNVFFISSKSAVIGGISFNLYRSSSVFSSTLDGELLATTDVAANKVNIYKISMEKSVSFPIINGLSLKDERIHVRFRIVDPTDSPIEKPTNLVVKDDGFQAPADISYVSQKALIYEFPNLDEILKMNHVKSNVVISRVSSFNGKVKSYFAPILLNNVVLYLVRDKDPTELVKLLVHLTKGAFISDSEVKYVENFLKYRRFVEFVASYPVNLPIGIDDVSVSCESISNLIDTVYYTKQNILK